MPFALLRAHAAKLGKLQAEEALRTATVIGLGSGTLKNHDEVRRDLERAAEPEPERPQAIGDHLARIRALGIQVIEEPKPR